MVTHYLTSNLCDSQLFVKVVEEFLQTYFFTSEQCSRNGKTIPLEFRLKVTKLGFSDN